jgi:hypothetical protein
MEGKLLVLARLKQAVDRLQQLSSKPGADRAARRLAEPSVRPVRAGEARSSAS